MSEPLWSNERVRGYVIEKFPNALSKRSIAMEAMLKIRDEYEARIANLENDNFQMVNHISSLQAELDCRDNQLQTVTRVEQTVTEIVVYGDPGEHNCDQMGCSSIEHVLIIIKK